MKSQYFSNLEQLYEMTLSRSISQINMSEFSDLERRLLSWLGLLEDNKFIEFYRTGEWLLSDSESVDEATFILYWLVVAAEVQYDLPLRSKYISQLEKLSQESFSIWLEYCKIYFLSNTHFFQADLILAEALINKALSLAKSISHPRAIARCYFQKALISKELQLEIDFRNNINYCLDICAENQFLKTSEKAKALSLNQLNSGYKDIEDALANKDFKYARHLIVKAESVRRSQGYGRKRFSINIYRIEWLLLSGKLNYARLFIEKIDDKILMFNIFSFMKVHKILLTDREKILFKSIGLNLGLDEDSFSDTKAMTVSKIQISKIKNDLVRKLITTLLAGEALDKETLFHSIYKIQYDPTIHDPKLYKLILRARNEFSSDVLINSYGKYQLNFEKYKFTS